MFSQLFSVKSFGADSSLDSFGMNLWLKNLRLWPEYYGLIRLRYGVIAYAAKCDVMPEYNVMKQLRIFFQNQTCAGVIRSFGSHTRHRLKKSINSESSHPLSALDHSFEPGGPRTLPRRLRPPFKITVPSGIWVWEQYRGYPFELMKLRERFDVSINRWKLLRNYYVTWNLVIPGVAYRAVLSYKPADRFRLRPVGEDNQSAVRPKYILNINWDTINICWTYQNSTYR